MKTILIYLFTALLICCFTQAPNPVLANSDLPPVVDEYRVMTYDWKIRENEPRHGFDLVCNHAGKSHTWPIDFQFVCDSLKHDVDNDAEVDQRVRDHLKEIDVSKTMGPLVVKVASLDKGGALFVRSLQIFDAYDSYHKACQFGSPMLGLDGPGCQRLSLEKYKQLINTVTDKDWRELTRR